MIYGLPLEHNLSLWSVLLAGALGLLALQQAGCLSLAELGLAWDARAFLWKERERERESERETKQKTVLKAVFARFEEQAGLSLWLSKMKDGSNILLLLL